MYPIPLGPGFPRELPSKYTTISDGRGTRSDVAGLNPSNNCDSYFPILLWNSFHFRVWASSSNGNADVVGVLYLLTFLLEGLVYRLADFISDAPPVLLSTISLNLFSNRVTSVNCSYCRSGFCLICRSTVALVLYRRGASLPFLQNSKKYLILLISKYHYRSEICFWQTLVHLLRRSTSNILFYLWKLVRMSELYINPYSSVYSKLMRMRHYPVQAYPEGGFVRGRILSLPLSSDHLCSFR